MHQHPRKRAPAVRPQPAQCGKLSGWAAVLATVLSSASPYGVENDGTKDGERRDPQGERE